MTLYPFHQYFFSFLLLALFLHSTYSSSYLLHITSAAAFRIKCLNSFLKFFKPIFSFCVCVFLFLDQFLIFINFIFYITKHYITRRHLFTRYCNTSLLVETLETSSLLPVFTTLKSLPLAWVIKTCQHYCNLNRIIVSPF